MSYYFGKPPVPGLTYRQSVQVEAWLGTVKDQSWVEGLRRMLLTQLGGDGPWENSEVTAALFAIFEAQGGIPAPLIDLSQED